MRIWRNLFLPFSLCCFVLPSCSESRGDEAPKTESITLSISPTSTPTIAEENFRKDWKSRYSQLKYEIIAARSKWEEEKIRSYSYVAAKYRGGHTSPWNRWPVLIKVMEDAPISVELVDKSDRSIGARKDGFEEVDTINKLFAYMLSELEKGWIVSAEYDEAIGYPRRVFIEEFLGPHGARGIEITKFSHGE
ncbi:MAG: DUF6174 domain-containing protein [Pyrinomonadaceae bacterium]